jgi:hypothetical protein
MDQKEVRDPKHDVLVLAAWLNWTDFSESVVFKSGVCFPSLNECHQRSISATAFTDY